MEEKLQLLLYPAASWGHTHCLSVLHNITFEVLGAQMPPPPPAGVSWWFSAYFQDPRAKARRSTRDVAQLVLASSSASWQISFEKRKKKRPASVKFAAAAQRRQVNCASDGTIGSLQPRGGPHSSLSPTGRAWLSTAASSSSSSASVAVLKLMLGVVCGWFHR